MGNFRIPWGSREAAAARVRHAATMAVSERLDGVLSAGIKEGKRVSKLGEIGDRIRTKKLKHDAIADEWAGRLDQLDKREPAAFAAGESVLSEREEDLRDMEKTMQTLSNLPLAGSDGS